MSLLSENKVAINLSQDLYDLVKQRVEESNGEFKDVEDYIEFVLREVVKSEEESDEKKFSKEDKEEIKQKLKSLGYL